MIFFIQKPTIHSAVWTFLTCIGLKVGCRVAMVNAVPSNNADT